MSYILDALRKAERERGIAQVPTLMTVHDAGSAKTRKGFPLVAAACVLCAAALVWVALAVFRPSDVPPDRSRNDLSEAIKEKQAVQETPTPDPASTAPAGSTERQDAGDLRNSDIWLNTPPAEAPTQEVPSDKPALRAKRPAASRETRPPGEAVLQQPAESKKVPSLNPAGTAAPEDSPPPGITLREAIAQMKISILVYDETKSERMVFINNRKYQEGDYIDGRYLVENITLEGAVLSYKEERALLRSQVK